MKKDHHHTHILIICSSLHNAGGLGRIIISLANKLCKDHYTLTLLILNHVYPVFYSLDKSIEIKTQTADFGIGDQASFIRRKINFIKDVKRLKKEVTNINPDIVITTEYTTTTAAVLGGLHRRYKLIVWQHGTFSIKKSRIWEITSRWAYKRAHHIVALSAEEQQQYKWFNQRTTVISNFIELPETISNLASKQILTIARFDSYKGIDLLIPAAAIVLNQHPDWQWKLIGKGDLQKEYSSSINKYGWHKNLIVQAPVSNEISNEYQQAAIYVLPSRNELFPMVLLEAMSHGVPCIAFDCDTGPRHIITDNVDGILVEKENPEKLAEAISLLIRDKEKRNHMGKAAFENVKRFSSDIVLKKWEALFNSLLHS